MKTLKEFMQERKYIAVIYDDETQIKLREWAINNGFDLTINYDGEAQEEKDFDFHTTIFYTTNEVYLKNKTIPEPPTEVKVSGIKFLGVNQDVPVLSVSLSGGVKKIRLHYEMMGLLDKWPSYMPHISLSYSNDKVLLDNVVLPDFKLKFDKIVIEGLK